MAATFVESIALPCLRLDLAPAPRAAAAAGTPLGRRGSAALPRFSGLRCSSPLHLSAATARSRVSRRGSVVCEAQNTALQLEEVSKSTWQSLVLDSNIPVLVDFWAPWCGPCRMIEPTIAKLAKNYEGKLKCYKLNTDENAEIANQYGIRSIPTMMIFKNSEKKESVIGAVPESALITCIEKFI